MKEKEEKLSSTLQIICFKVSGEEYGIEILKVQEIVKLPSITQIPKSAEYIRGVIDLRGRVIPVVDLAKRFGLDVSEDTKKTRAVVIDIQDKRVAIVIDEISQVLKIRTEDIEQAPPIVKGISGKYIMGIGKIADGFVIILDIDKIFSSSELSNL